MELEKAYRTLDLKPGATFKEVSEAREDLLTLWDPDRLAHHPRLRTRGESKIREVNEAYRVLMEHLGQTGVRRSPAGEVRQSERTAGHGGTVSPSASLFDEVFSARPTRVGRSGLFWILILSALLVIVLIGFWLLSGAPSEPAEDTLRTPVTSDPGTAANGRSSAPAGKLEGEPPPNTAGDSGTAVPVPDGSVQAPSDAALPATSTAGADPGATVVPRSDQGTPLSSSGTADLKPSRVGGDRPVLERGRLEDADSEALQQKEAVQEVERAVEILLSRSSAARNLTRGKTGDLHFSEWLLVKRTEGELWIGRIAAESGGRPIQFIWSVDLESQKVRPVSEPALNLENSSN